MVDDFVENQGDLRRIINKRDKLDSVRFQGFNNT